MKNIHIALDLDKTIAFYEGHWKATKVGEPILPMVERVKEWLNKGYRVTIFTARLDREEGSEDYEKQINMITEFLKRAGLPNLPKTATKLREFTHFIDDRAWNCEANKGIIDNNIDI